VTGERLLRALGDLIENVPALHPVARVTVPDPAELRLEQVLSPRDAFFGRVEQVPAAKAAGRISAEMLTPYRPASLPPCPASG
jgi:arginine decarboxylase